MYIYFSSNGTVKEIINYDNPVAGDSEVNVIYAMFENDQTSGVCSNAYIKYTLASGSVFPTSSEKVCDATETLSLTADANRDLYFFEYGKSYQFRKFIIPDDVLANSGSTSVQVTASIRYTYTAGGDKTMNRIAFSVAPNNDMFVEYDGYVSLAQYNDLLTNKQDTLPTTTTAGKVLKSTSVAGAVEWGDAGVSSVAFSDITGNATDNASLNTALNSKQNQITNSNKLSADLVDDSNADNKFVTSSEKSTWNAKQSALPTTTTAGQVLKSTATAGTTEWGSIPTYTAGNGLDLTGTEFSVDADVVATKSDTAILEAAINQKEATANKVTTIGNDSNTEFPTVTAVKNYVNASITSLAATYVTYNASGDSFPTKAALTGASTYYHDGATYTPSTNDYAIVLVDETHDSKSSRYIYTGSTWSFQYTLGTSFTQAQQSAIDSGVTSAKVSSYDTHIASTSNPHSVTASQVGLGNVDNTSDVNKPISTATQTALNNKQDTLTAGTGITLSSNTISVNTSVIQEKLNSGVNANVIAPLYVDTGELRISLGNGVHKTSDDALEAALKSNGGLLMDANGIYVDTTEIQEKLTFDNSPVQNSTNPVTSGGIYTVQQNLVEQIAGKRAAYVIIDSNKVYNGSTAYASGTDLGNKYFTKIDISSTSTPSYVTISDMQAGDIIYIINSGIPDVWLAGFDNNDTLGYLAPLETQSPTLTNYYTKTETDTLLTNKEATSNKVTSLSSSSTDTQYPSAKCVYDLIGDIETTLSTIIGSNS